MRLIETIFAVWLIILAPSLIHAQLWRNERRLGQRVYLRREPSGVIAGWRIRIISVKALQAILRKNRGSQACTYGTQQKVLGEMTIGLITIRSATAIQATGAIEVVGGIARCLVFAAIRTQC